MLMESYDWLQGWAGLGWDILIQPLAVSFSAPGLFGLAPLDLL